MSNITVKEDSYFETLLTIQELGQANLQEAQHIFDSYYEKGIFKGCKFSDLKWNSTDEYANVGLYFNFNELMYNRCYRAVFQMNFGDFVNYVKVYVTYTLGKNVLKTLQSLVNDLKRIIRTSLTDLYDGKTDLKISVPSLCLDFFTLLPATDEQDSLEKLIEVLDLYVSINQRDGVKKQRQLAQFDSYFMFNDIINDYWSKPLERQIRLFFYPLYLWWQVTGVIPLRPKEFILTQRSCLDKREDGYYLTLQRNNLKGSQKSVSYKLADDYYQVTYKIPDALAKNIKQYLDFTNKYDDTEIKTLFVSDPHYQHWHQKKHRNSRFLTYVNLSTIMRYFFHDVIEKEYGLTIIYGNQEGHLKRNQINYLHLGDTRHLALINIMAEGGTPVTAMMLAGHDNIEMSAHYYSNISNLIECQTYRQYRLITKGQVQYEVSTTKGFPIKQRDKFAKLSNGGRCYSEKYQQGDFTDCKLSAGKSGELGYCPTCPFYRKPGRGYYNSDNMYKRAIKDNCQTLSEAVHQVRLGNGDTEDIGEAMLRLKASSYSYEKYYQEKLARKQRKGSHVWDGND